MLQKVFVVKCPKCREFITTDWLEAYYHKCEEMIKEALIYKKRGD